MNTDFSGKTAIVTGAAHGFGRAISIAFARCGAHVWACDVLGDELDETERLCRDAGGACTPRFVDVRVKGEVDEFVAAASAASGSVHILVNNAGGVLGQVGRPLEEITPAEWQVIFDVNVTATFLCTQAVAPGMKAARFGRIVNISSGAGLGISLTGIQAYASAKAAQIGLTRQIAHELGPWNITVNSIAPGFVRSNPSTSGSRTARRDSARSSNASRSGGSAPPTTSPTACSSSRRTTPTGSRAKCSPSTVAGND